MLPIQGVKINQVVVRSEQRRYAFCLSPAAQLSTHAVGVQEIEGVPHHLLPPYAAIKAVGDHFRVDTAVITAQVGFPGLINQEKVGCSYTP